MGLYTPTILRGNSYLSWFYDRGTIKDRAHTGTSKGLSQAINRGPIRKFQPKYANVYVTIQSHGLSVGARTHYVTANGVRNRLTLLMKSLRVWGKGGGHRRGGTEGGYRGGGGVRYRGTNREVILPRHPGILTDDCCGR